MKKIIPLVYFLLLSFACISQTEFDKALSAISNDLAGKLKVLNKKRVVVLYITDMNKSMTTAGKYMADNVSYNFVNNLGTFTVFERDNLAEMKESKDLMKEGYFVDSNRAAELGRALNVDVIIVGSYTVLSKTVKLTLKALNSVNGFLIAVSMMDLPLNQDAASLLDITVVSDNQSDNYNNPASGEANGRTSKNPDCKTKNIGDYCFTNNTPVRLCLDLFNNGLSGVPYYSKRVFLEAGEKQCFYDLPVGQYTYTIQDLTPKNNTYSFQRNSPPVNSGGAKRYDGQGNIYIEVCQSKAFIIR